MTTDPTVRDLSDYVPDDEHPEDTCKRCGRPNPVWWVDSDRYNTAVNRSEIVCPVCFIEAHERATGMTTSWKLEPAAPFRWIDPDGRSTPFYSPHPEGPP